MFEIFIAGATFAQPSKYVIIVKNDEETKRSQVCSQWTSVPVFAEPVTVNSLNNLEVKVCTATIDRKLTVLGSFSVDPGELSNDRQIIFQGSRNFLHMIEDTEVCVGKCDVKIVKKVAKKDEKSELYNVDDEFQLKSQQQSEEEDKINKCRLKFILHGGYDFYLNSGFKINLRWGAQKAQTKTIYNKITPFWGQSINLDGSQSKLVSITVVDDKNNQLQWMRLDPKSIRIMYPYHLHVYFREEYVGLNPHFFMTIIREDVPLFSVIDKKIEFNVGYVGPVAPQKTQQYLLIYPKQIEGNQHSNLPLFIDINLQNYVSFDTINKIIQNTSDRKYEWTNWNILYPVNVGPDAQKPQPLSVLKSFLNKSLVCVYFSIDDSKSLFLRQIWDSVTVFDKKDSFENCIKAIYYEEKKIIIGKAVQLTNIDLAEAQNGSNLSPEEKWKLLSSNYILRKKLLTKSVENTEHLKKSIQEKGLYIEQLKKVLIEVKKINAVIMEKQRSAMVPSKGSQKIREDYQQYPTIEIIAMLLEKQVELEKRKRVNDEMRMRMDSLHYFNEDSEQLDKAIVSNATRLLEQQAKIRQMKKMREALPKQREIILRLERIFEAREIDKSMNELLKKEQVKLHQIKKASNGGLEEVYKIVKQHKSGSNSLMESIKNAEQQLIRLNAEYARLTTE